MEEFGLESFGDRLVLTAVDTAGIPMLEVSCDLMAKYALRMGADFKIISQSNRSSRTLPRPHAVKFHMANELNYYKTVLWIDADCLVSPSAPNIFDNIPDSVDFAAWCQEGEAFSDSPTQRPKYNHGYFNSGVMLARSALPFKLALNYMTNLKDKLTDQELKSIMGEQTPLNKAVHDLGVKVHRLSEKWNFLLSEQQAHKLGVEFDLQAPRWPRWRRPSRCR